jgi:hypothetical protein
MSEFGLREVVRDVAALLARADVPFMIAGSVASSFHGESRSTRDLDLVIEIDAAGRRRLFEMIDRDVWYVDEAEALSSPMFNLVDLRSGWKVDVVLRRSTVFAVEEFARRQTVDLFGTPVPIASAEDVVLAKLWWAREGGSDRQVRDAQAVVEVQGERLDRDYLLRWAPELGVAEQVAALLARRL